MRANKRRAGADHFRARACYFTESFVLALQGALCQRVLDGYQHAVAAQRFFEEVKGSGAGGGYGVGNGGLPGNHDHGGGDLAGLEFAQQFDAVSVGQADVHQEQVDAGQIGKGAQFGARPRRVHLITLALEDHAKRTADILFVVKNQNAPGHELGKLSDRREAGRGSRRRRVLRRWAGCRRPKAARCGGRWKGRGPCLSS